MDVFSVVIMSNVYIASIEASVHPLYKMDIKHAKNFIEDAKCPLCPMDVYCV